jgi:hypothetical protein
MPELSSPMSLHLKYRLWIAELNFDINVLRIFGDYLAELRSRRKEQEVKMKADYFEKSFQKLRTEIDELRHDMHIGKMKLGAFGRGEKPFDFKVFNSENHSPLKKRLAIYKSEFKNINEEFEDFEGEWLT